MSRGVGMDLVDLVSFREQLADAASTFVEGSFTERERADVQTRPAKDKTPHFAARYAAKEAFIKAWSATNTGNAPALSHINMKEIEVALDSWGRPRLTLHGNIGRAFQHGETLQTHLSLSHDGGFAAAFVVVETVEKTDSEVHRNGN